MPGRQGRQTARVTPCRTCGSPLAADQRYCLECGERHGPPRLDWKAMATGHAAAGPLAAEHDDGVGPGLPSPRIAAALVLGVLAFGAVLGNAAGPDAADAGHRPRMTIVAGVAPAAAPAPVPASVPAPATTEPPADEGGASTPVADEGDASTPGADDGAADQGDAPADTTAPEDASSGDAPAATDDDPSTDDGTTDNATAPAPQLPPVKHVWVVALTGHSYDESFGPASPAPYLSQELRAQGTLLPWYHAAGHDPAAGGVALLGGQKDATGPFDDKTVTLPDQLSSIGQSWRAYVEGATTAVAAGDSPCSAAPETQPRNPFLRFATITGGSDCPIAEPAQLATDVAEGTSAPAFSYILPGPAHDGSTSLADADAWLKATLPAILTSPAYADGGLVVVTFDAGAPADAEAGGGRVGALLLSPFVTAGGTVSAPYDPFSLLASIQGLFGLDPLLGHAKETTLKAFGPKVYAAWSPADS
jgi:hypothetical protein